MHMMNINVMYRVQAQPCMYCIHVCMYGHMYACMYVWSIEHVHTSVYTTFCGRVKAKNWDVFQIHMYHLRNVVASEI